MALYYYALRIPKKTYKRFHKSVLEFYGKLCIEDDPGYKYIVFGIDDKLDNPRELLGGLRDYPEWPQEQPLDSLTGDEFAAIINAASDCEGLPQKMAIIPTANNVFHKMLALCDTPKPAVMLVMTLHRNKDTGLASPGMKEMLRLIPQFTDKTIRRAINELEGHLLRRHGGGWKEKATEYHVFDIKGCTECKPFLKKHRAAKVPPQTEPMQ